MFLASSGRPGASSLEPASGSKGRVCRWNDLHWNRERRFAVGLPQSLLRDGRVDLRPREQRRRRGPPRLRSAGREAYQSLTRGLLWRATTH
jgi:hypothetical protein